MQLIQLEPQPSFSPKHLWWIEVKTEIPHCIYYFGPFASIREAAYYQEGYLEDLAQEGAQGISATMTERIEPSVLTID